MAPTVSVVIPSYRRLDRLPGLVTAYLDQGADEVVVVLDGPHEGWERALATSLTLPDVTVEALPENVGLALARIAGLRVARGDVVLAVDDDVEPGSGLVRRHRDFHAASQNGVLLGYMPIALPARRSSDDAPTFLYARDYLNQSRAWRSGDSIAILNSLWGGNVSIRRDLYSRAEALLPSVRLEYNEDLDLGIRLERVGAAASFDPEALATHHHRRGIRAYLRECEARGGAIADLEDRWGARPAQLTPMVVIPAGYSRVFGMLQRRLAARDAGGVLQGALVFLYRLCGAVRAFRLQDAVTRLMRRGLIMRGYRLARDSGVSTGSGLGRRGTPVGSRGPDI